MDIREYSEIELKDELQRRKEIFRIDKDTLKVELLKEFVIHFEKEKGKGKGLASSSFNVREVHGGVEQGSYIYLEIFHYGIENYYGAKIKDLLNLIIND
jgi:hypothetical protein